MIKNIVLVFKRGGGNNWKIVPGLSVVKEIISYEGVRKGVRVSKNIKWGILSVLEEVFLASTNTRNAEFFHVLRWFRSKSSAIIFKDSNERQGCVP